MNRSQFLEKHGAELDRQLASTELRKDLIELLDTLEPYMLAHDGAFGLLSCMPTSLSDMLEPEAYTAYRKLNG